MSIAKLHRWHAEWERDHPDLIVWSSFEDYLPSEQTLRREREIAQLCTQMKRFSGSALWVGPN